jgi:hypothetical protein
VTGPARRKTRSAICATEPIAADRVRRRIRSVSCREEAHIFGHTEKGAMLLAAGFEIEALSRAAIRQAFACR